MKPGVYESESAKKPHELLLTDWTGDWSWQKPTLLDWAESIPGFGLPKAPNKKVLQLCRGMTYGKIAEQKMVQLAIFHKNNHINFTGFVG